MNKNQKEKRSYVRKVVNITPSWVGLMPLFFNWLFEGNPEQKQLAKDEIMRLAQFADNYNKVK